ncbi:MAG: hypothetical protein J0L92_32795 [Deltaproteobacteria bacterium]|nr:hypothetical protein [Deltaproteobacteria bacterium]
MRERARRWIGRGLLAAALVLVAYAALLLDPSPLFAHTLRRGALIAHVDAPIPAALSETLDEATRRLSRSPLFDPGRLHHLYFCQSEWRWRLFAHWNRGAAGFALAPFSRVVFLRRAQLERDRMIGPSGRVVTGERTLAYYVAHESTHTITADHLGLAYAELPVWVREGYADYVGRGDTFDYGRVRRQLLEGARETDPASGHYLRYALLVAHELDVRGVRLEDLLTAPRASTLVERDVRRGE